MAQSRYLEILAVVARVRQLAAAQTPVKATIVRAVLLDG